MITLNVTIDTETVEEMNGFINGCLFRPFGYFVPNQGGCCSNPPSEKETGSMGEGSDKKTKDESLDVAATYYGSIPPSKPKLPKSFA